jgi:hypothetical protein
MAKSLAALAAVVILLGIINAQPCNALARASDSNDAISTSKKSSSNITGGLSHQLDKMHGYGKQQHWRVLSRRLLKAKPCKIILNGCCRCCMLMIAHSITATAAAACHCQFEDMYISLSLLGLQQGDLGY